MCPEDKTAEAAPALSPAISLLQCRSAGNTIQFKSDYNVESESQWKGNVPHHKGARAVR